MDTSVFQGVWGEYVIYIVINTIKVIRYFNEE